ncbi:restriction endonuclease subunit S [Vibrio parahaemolyticus]|uniref:restriction endonuclease subunit S n=1 Tax=Vibrio parahaemolyticus TaxID=670 RepID=UPI002160381A|nr:restriction endonuclease subunit S [Vibrio parahaemolyticus]MCS0093947.1 restriction endonuclease subunit S [Vibrio parahaemolyticus]
MNNWQVKTLGEYLSLQRGYDLTAEQRTKGNIPVMGAGGQNGTHGVSKASGPGVIVGRSGSSYGQVYLSEGDFWPHNTSMFVTDFKGNDEYFTYYLLKNLDFDRLNSGSAQPSLNRNFIYPVKVRVPKPNEQTKISAVLRAIDQKIELNNRINTELEAMAKTLYDYWFVQFDFPDVNGKPYKASGGKMVYDPVLKQEIPADWHVNAISDWIRSDKTGDWGKETKQGNYTLQVDCIRGADINGINGQGNVDAPNRFILKKNDHKLLAPFDFVIEISGGSPTQSTGRMAFITEHVLERFDYPLICSNFCKAIDLIDKSYFYNFAYQWQSLYENGVLFGWEGKTSGIKNLLFDSFVSNYNVVMPPKDLAEKFFQFVSPLQEQRQKKLKENAELAGLRDWLLPMLMNGQVTVKPSTESKEAQHG